MNTKTSSLVIGSIFILVGLVGFTSNPVIGETNAIFHADSFHNMVHIISGALFILIALAAPASAALILKIFGVVYFLLGVLGLFTIGNAGMTKLLGVLHVNGADNYLHIGLGIVIFLAGIAPGRTVRGV